MTHFSPILKPFQKRNMPPCQLFQFKTTSMCARHLPASVSMCPDTSWLKIKSIPPEEEPSLHTSAFTAVQCKIPFPLHSLPFDRSRSHFHCQFSARRGPSPPHALPFHANHTPLCICCHLMELSPVPFNPPFPLHSMQGGGCHLSICCCSTQAVPSPLYPLPFYARRKWPFPPLCCCLP